MIRHKASPEGKLQSNRYIKLTFWHDFARLLTKSHENK